MFHFCNYNSHQHALFTDISHATYHHHPDLRQRGEKTVFVYDSDRYEAPAEDDEYSSSVVMHAHIKTLLEEYANDLEKRLGVGSDVTRLPVALAVSALLNPMFGLEPLIVGSGLMSETQYHNARNTLLRMMQDYFDAKEQPSWSGADSDSEDSRDGIMASTENVNYTKALAELELFEKHKKVKYHPEFESTSDYAVLRGSVEDDNYNQVERSISIGCNVTVRGKDLPSKKNLADYIDFNGRFDVLSFFLDHKRIFPTLFIIAQREASRKVAEVGCERFFSLSGYVSAPRRTRLGVRTYEQLAMLASNLNNVYVDPEIAAKEYLRRSELGLWKREFAEDALKSWNLERLIEAELLHRPTPNELSMEDMMEEDSSNCDIMEIDG